MAKKLTLRQQIEERDAAYAELGEQNETLRISVHKTQAAFAAKFEEADKLKESIALFKQEALQAAVREAELRGYVQRTLEDDAVREPAPVKSELTDDQRQHMIERLGRDDRARNHPAPRRTGPSAMFPQVIVRDGCDDISEHWRPHAWDRAVTMRNDQPSRNDPLGQRHWLNR